jgi:N-acetylglucosamine repressor
VQGNRTAQRPENARTYNRALVYRSIWEQEETSRSDLAKVTGLSVPITTEIVGELIDASLVRETGTRDSTGGRPSIGLRSATDAWYILAIDIARFRTTIAIIDLKGGVVDSFATPTLNSSDPATNLSWLIDLVADRLRKQPRARKRLLGIGIGAPGPLYAEKGEFLSVTNFGDWHDLALRDALERRFRVPVKVDNDANVCALAHCFFGIGREVSDFAYFAVGSGVGSGVVLHGNVYRGSHGLAGEIGHTTVEVNGPKCPCGNYGCLELYTTVAATLARWGSRDQVDVSDETAGVEALMRAVALGEQGALSAIARTAEYLSVGVINLVNSYDPEVVIIGRELARAGKPIIEPIQRAVAGRAFPAARRPIRVVQDSLGDAAPITGAFCLVLSELMDPSAPMLDGLVASATGSKLIATATS